MEEAMNSRMSLLACAMLGAAVAAPMAAGEPQGRVRGKSRRYRQHLPGRVLPDERREPRPYRRDPATGLKVRVR